MGKKCKYCDGTGKDKMIYQDYTPNSCDECPYCDGTGLNPDYIEESN